MRVENAYVWIGCAEDGGWGLTTIAGDPANPDDDDKILIYDTYGGTNGLSVKIDGTLYVLEDNTTYVTTPMALGPGGTYASIGWTIAGVSLTARYELVASDSGREDTARVTYTFYNPPAKTSRHLGFKVGLDTMIGDNDAARLATAAGIIDTETGFGDTGAGGTYPDPVPAFYQAFEVGDIADPGVVAQGTFVGGGATQPDKFVIGRWSAVSRGSNFDYTPTGNAYGDSAVGMWWFDRNLEAGSSMSFVVLYGLGSITAGGGDLLMALAAPAALAPAGSDFDPNPFTVLVQLQNETGTTLVNLPVTIDLPACLSPLAKGGSATQYVASLANGANTALAFLVYADPGCGGTTQTYSVTAGAGQPYAVTLEKTVDLPVVTLDCDASAWNFVHVRNTGYLNAGTFPEIVTTVSVDTPHGRACELGMANFAVAEDSVPQTITSLTCAATGGSVADLAVVFDDTGSMGGQIEDMKARASAFAEAIAAEGVDARFALVSFGDNYEIGIDLDFTSSVANFQAAVDTLFASGGGDTPEAAVDAVYRAATELSWRPGAQRFFLLITDAPTHYVEDGSGLADRGMAETVATVEAMGGSVFAVGPNLGKGKLLDNQGRAVAPKAYGDPDDVKTLAYDTGGDWQDFYAVDFNAWLDDIIDIVTSVYTVVYTSTNPARDGSWREVVVTVTDTVEDGVKTGTVVTDCDDGTYQAPYGGFECDQGEGEDFVHVQAVGYATTDLFPEITATVRVDTEAGYNCELTREDFAAWEDGVWQTITSVTCAGTGGSVADIAICFDDTGSMGGEIGTMQAEATQFVRDIVGAGVDARFALVSFKDDETIRQDFTADSVAFQAAVNALVASGGGDTPETSFDAVMLAVTGLVWREGVQRIVIVITDAPSHYRDEPAGPATYNLGDVVAACTDSGTSVFAVGPLLTKGQVQDNEGNLVALSSGKTDRPDDVRRVAEGTGGLWQDINTAEFDEILARIVRVITSLYTVVYTTTNSTPDGTWREVTIQVTDPVEGTDCDDGTYQAPYAPIECVNGQGNDFVGLQSVGYAEDVIFPQITATVRVDTEAGRNCELTREDFALSEDGVVQRITSVTCAGSAGSVADIVICFDDTGSMGGEIGTMQAEATQFVGNIAAAGVDARFALISFKDDETLRQDFTTDVVTFQNAVNALVASGGGDTPETSFDAVMLAVNGLAWRAGAQRLVIVITDAPSHYRDEPAGPAAYNLADVVDACTASGTAVFAVGPLLTKGQLEDNQGNPVDLPPAKTGRPDDVRLLAEGTGGFWQDINTAEFDDILAEIVEVITSLYTVIYTTSNDVRDGSWREVIVSVTDPVQGTDCDDGWYQAPEDCVLLEVAPLDLYAVCLTGTNPGDVCFSVANGCAGWMEYGIEWEDDWLTVSPTGGVSTWDWNEHCVEFDAAWLPPGSYEGTIYVYAGEQIEIVTVHLTVTDLLVVRDFPDDCFGPGDEVDVAVTFYFAGSSPVTSLALYETLPEGWSFVDVVSGDPRPDMQFGASSLDLEFYWLEIPAFPYTLVYRVQAPAVKTETETYGWHCFDGQAAWRTTGAENWIGVFGETCIELLDCTEPCAAHQADQDGDWLMELRVELSRMIQFYNYRGYHVRAGSEDGYDPGVGSTAGDPHQADQNRNWVIQLSPDLTRLIQFYNSGGYHCQAGTEDGYAPGLFAPKASGQKGTLTSARSFGSALYNAGTTLDVSVTLTHTAPAALSSLVVEEALPAGWSFNSVVTTPAPTIRPAPGATGTLGFGWITMPTVWPVTLTYRVNVPAGTTGPRTFTGTASFREDSGETTVTTAATVIQGNERTVTHVAGAGGNLTGTPVQTVPTGTSTTAVTAVPLATHRFVHWTRAGAHYSNDNPLTVANVTETMTLTAVFEPNNHLVTFVAGAGGLIVGTNPQTVLHGGNGTAVTAQASYGFVFTGWTDGVPTATRTPTGITADHVFTATFRVANAVPPPWNGTFTAVTDATAVAAGRGLWDLTGIYTVPIAGNPLVLNLNHDTKGKLTGAATYTVAKATVVAMAVKGSAKGTAGNVLVAIALKGADAAKTVAVSLSFKLTLNAATRQLVGPVTGSVTVGGVNTPVNTNVTLDIAPPMDGTWTLQFVLTQGAKGITGTAKLVLSNGADYDYVIKGKVAGQTAVLSLAGAATDPAAKGIKIKTTITPLEGAWGRLNALSAKGYGQGLVWTTP